MKKFLLNKHFAGLIAASCHAGEIKKKILCPSIEVINGKI
jgi:hypothetical protein